MTLRVPRLTAVLVGLLTCLAVLTVATAYIHRQLMTRSGLAADYRAGTIPDGEPWLRAVDDDLAVPLVRQRKQELGGSAFTVTWTGYVIVPAHGTYRFALYADDRASLEIDRRLVVDVERTRRVSSLELGRGLHPITIRYADAGGRQGFELLWALGDGTPLSIPRLLFVPQLVSAGDARQRRIVSALSSWLPLACSAFLIASIATLVIRRLAAGAEAPSSARAEAPAYESSVGAEAPAYESSAGAGAPAYERADWRMALICVAAGLVFAAGIWWGLPDYEGWAADELTPGELADVLERRFSGGWATTYPPLHYGVVLFCSAPVYLSARFGLVDLNGLRGYMQIFLVGRMVSVAMAIGMLALIYRLTRDELGARAARLAAVVMALILPLTYYARTTNLDVPYLFWLTWSLVFYVRAGRTGGAASYCLFALTGAAAIATKDQAYGFYVLPAAHMVGGALWHARDRNPPPGVPSLRVLCAMAAIFAGAMVVFFNVPFNLAGVREHLRLIVGPGSQPYRMYPRTPAGHARMFGEALRQIGSAMSWPMFAIGAWGIAAAVRARIRPIRRLLLPAVSYYLTFIMAIMYPYDRFFIGICIPLAIAAAWRLDRWTRADAPHRRVKLAVVGLAVAYAAARVVALDALTLLDSRYYVERWLVARAGPDTVIGAEGPASYLPRPSRVLWARVGQDLGALEMLHPDYLVVNPAYDQRGVTDASRNEFYDALDDGRAHYRRVLRYRTWLPLSPLRWEPRFNQVAEDPFSNVTKVNPLIDVYERIP